MSMFYHCPICWDGKDSCKCSESDFKEYNDKLELERKQQRQQERLKFHELLDNSFDAYEKRNIFLEPNSFPIYFLRQVLKELKRGDWFNIRKSFDDWFDCKNNTEK